MGHEVGESPRRNKGPALVINDSQWKEHLAIKAVVSVE